MRTFLVILMLFLLPVSNAAAGDANTVLEYLESNGLAQVNIPGEHITIRRVVIDGRRTLEIESRYAAQLVSSEIVQECIGISSITILPDGEHVVSSVSCADPTLQRIASNSMFAPFFAIIPMTRILRWVATRDTPA